jgi:predicted O-linked N-acetylglucosamine transferase (SPINDLY family)
MKDRGKTGIPADRLSSSNDVAALFTQALGLHQAGKLGEAKIIYEKILSTDDRHPGALSNLGAILTQAGQHEAAIRLLGKSLAINPNQPIALLYQGGAHQSLNHLDEALASYDRALALRPDFAEAHNNRGNALKELKRLDEALANFDRALALRPDFAQSHNNRGNALKDLGRAEEALASYERALHLSPNSAEAYNNRGNALKDLGRLDEALASYERALVLRPDYTEAHYNRGNVLKDLGRLDEALASYDRALALNSDFPDLLGSWLHSKMHCCDWSNLGAAYTDEGLANNLDKHAFTPFFLLALPSTLAQQQYCARNGIRHRFSTHSAPLWRGERYAHERVRIGYFSSDFCDHPVAHLITHLIESHDRTRFEIIGFSIGPPSNDIWRQRLEKTFDRFFEVMARSDKDIAALVREQEIDVAVDLNGYTKKGRLGVFAQRPAPVQVNYLGYPGTLGAGFMDYFIADSTLIPREHQQYYDEKIVYLPHSFQVNDSTKTISERRFSRTELGLPEGAFVYCCFNNSYKITPDVFDIWMRLLQAVSESVLWLSGVNATAARNLRLEAKKRGISPDRLIFAPRMESLADHLARHRQADLFLDTFYYNAHTTASDALWAGLPVLTCLGNSLAGRVAASLLKAVGLPEMIVHSHAEYETLALELATHPERLAAIRRKLAENRGTHPLFDTARFTGHIEEAYMKMFERYQAGLSPDHIVVDP